MEIHAINAQDPCRYLVAPRLGLWRVLKNDSESRTFAERDDAVRFACAAARDRARAGLVGIVVVRGDVDEVHCYSPPPVPTPAPGRPALRLVGEDR